MAMSAEAHTVAPVTPTDSIEAGDVVGRYRVDRAIGEGGQGRVFKGTHLMLGYPVAIKVLGGSSGDASTALRRMHREARLGAVVRHRNLVGVLEAGTTARGEHYLVMEYVEGESLASLIDRGPLPPATVLDLALQLTSAVMALEHDRIVHRDIKPENVIMERAVDGAVLARLLDFGLAKSPADAAAGKITRQGSVLGTPHYMSPEQVRGARLDSRADLYSLGALLYECVTGVPPHNEPTLAGVLASVTTRPAPSLAETAPGCPRALVHVIDRCLESHPDERWQGPAEMSRALRAAAIELQLTRTQDVWAPVFGSTPARSASAATKSEVSDVRTQAEASWPSVSRPALPKRRRHMLWGAAAAALVAGGLGLAALASPASTEASPVATVGTTTEAPTKSRDVAAADAPSPESLERAARGLFVRGEDEAALSLYRRVVERDPGRASAWRGAGLVAASLGHREEARRALRRYLALDPAAPDRDEVIRRLEAL